MAELLALPYQRASIGGIVTSRSFNHSGPGQSPSFFLSSLAKQFAEIESDSRPPKLKVGNLNVKRDFTDVRDIVIAYDMLLDKGKAGETYNVCSGVSVSLADIVQMFQAITGVNVAIESDPNRIRSNEIVEICGDPRKLRDLTGWCPMIPLEQTIWDLVNHWRFTSREGTVQFAR
jgi:GDP-4-dehydro-6-deoxy-D-mannose reductase